MNLKSILSTVLGLVFTALPTLASNVANPVLHAIVIGAGAVVGVFVHHQATSSRLWNGNPFGSITVSAIVTAVLGFIAAHVDPSQLTSLGAALWGVVGAVVGALTHHAVTAPSPAQS